MFSRSWTLPLPRGFSAFGLGGNIMSFVGSDKLTKAGFSGGGWAGEAWRWALKYNYVPHRWNLFFGCHTLQTSFRLPGVTPQWTRRGWAMGLSYYSAWHWGRADWTLGFWLLLSLSLGLGWSNAGWPGHYLRECACLSKSPCSRPSKLFPRRKYVLLAWMGLFLPFAWQDLGREFLGSLKLLLATTGEAWRWASKTYFLTGAKQ